MIEEIEDDRDKTAIDLFRNKEINHNNVCHKTICTFLNNKGLKARIKTRVPDISNVNK